MSDVSTDHAALAWAASLASAAVAWFARSFGFGRAFGRIEERLDSMARQSEKAHAQLTARFDRMETRINQHLDRRD